MRRMACIASFTAVAGLVMPAPGLMADEVCYSEYLSPTADESAAMQEDFAAALAALPSEFDGWASGGDGRLDVTSQCGDHDPRPWSFGLARTFDRVDDLAEREQMGREAGATYQAARQANQSRTDEIMARIQELSERAMAAAEAGDYARVDAINVEIEEAVAEQTALMEGAATALDAAGEEISRDHWIRVAVEVNPVFQSLGYQARQVPAPSGASHAFRWQDTSHGPSNETEVVLLGAWVTDGDSCESAPRAGVAQAVPQSISVAVTADESRIDSVLETIDFAALAALVSR